MAVLGDQIKMYKSATVSEAAGNGGRLGTVESVSGAAGNIFGDVSQTERTAGSEKYRKMFIKVESPTNEALVNAKVFLKNITPGDDLVQFFEGTETDTQADIDNPDLYGAGVLSSSVLAGASEIEVQVEDWSEGAIFRDGDLIRIEGGGNVELHTIDGSPSADGNVITLTLAGTLANGYTSGQAVVSSGIELGDIEATFDNYSETSDAGTFDEAEYLEVNAIGGILQTWTITFTGATTFNLSGDQIGAVGSGSIGSDFSPVNSVFSEPYFTLRSAGWGGSWQNGDTITFRTHPAAKAIWFRRVVPEGASSQSANGWTTVIAGESV